MSKHIKLIVSLLVLLGSGITLMWSSNLSRVRSQSGRNDPFASLDYKAQAAKSGDKAAVRELADEVFKRFGLADVDSGALAPLKDRLARAEVDYRRSGKGGVRENKVMQTVNELADSLGAPAYAKVDLLQVRYLRTNMIVSLSNFIGQVSIGGDGKSSVNPEMSPLEAAGITLLLLYQKVYNEDYQVTPEEWRDIRYKQELAKWQAHKNGSPPPEEKVPKNVAKVESLRTAELKQVLARAAQSMGPGSLMTVAHRSLDTLGIPR
jgi:hypothetical protein